MTRLVTRSVRPAPRFAPASLFGDLDRLFGVTRGAFPGASARNGSHTVVPRIDITESDEAWRIDAELPGFDQNDIDVSIDEGVLTISASREQEEKSEDEESGYRHLERYRGNFRRSLRLPEDVDGAAIKASYMNGVLALTVPKPPKVEPEVLQVPVTVE